MKISYDKEADAMYIKLKKGVFAKNKKIDENTILDLDKNDNILNIELLDVSKRITPESIAELKEKSLIAA